MLDDARMRMRVRVGGADDRAVAQVEVYVEYSLPDYIHFFRGKLWPRTVVHWNRNTGWLHF